MVPQIRDAELTGEDAALRAMFAARKEVFIDLLGWDLPVLAGRYELDQFDDAEADYLILMEGAAHRASTRLLRTDRPHLLSDLFAHLCAGPLPQGPTIREITRFCLDRHQNAGERRSARNQLVSALALHALERGVTAYTGVADVGWFAQIRQFGWQCEPLGQPVRCDGRELVALHIHIDRDTPDRLRSAGIWETPSLALMTDGAEREYPL